MSLNALIDRLDLHGHIDSFNGFLSRHKPLFIEGDQERHFNYIEALDRLSFNAPPKVDSFHTIKAHLKKQGIMRFEQIFEIIKVVRYFRSLKNNGYEGMIGEWLQKIEIPERFGEEDESYFDLEGNFNEELDEEIGVEGVQGLEDVDPGGLELGVRVELEPCDRILETQAVDSEEY